MTMLLAKQAGRVRILTLDRPARRNALGGEMTTELQAALRAAEEDPQTGAIVLTGTPPGFCAGSDLKELATLDIAGMCAHEAHVAAVARSIALGDKPVIAAVDGFALGGGFVLAISCDIVVSTPAARWHLPEVALGWIPPWGLATLEARVGVVSARRLTWGGEPLDGREAHRLGVADYLAEGDVVQAAVAIAERLAALPAPAVAATKRYFAAAATNDGEAADALAGREFAENCREEAALATLQRFGVKQ
jgi:enoyl-CoA hydratase/carnithine racemase